MSTSLHNTPNHFPQQRSTSIESRKEMVLKEKPKKKKKKTHNNFRFFKLPQLCPKHHCMST